jgi:hypothetical protein
MKQEQVLTKVYQIKLRTCLKDKNLIKLLDKSLGFG